MKNTILSAVILSFGVSALGLTQAQTWTHFAMFTFGAVISLGIIGLIATEK